MPRLQCIFYNYASFYLQKTKANGDDEIPAFEKEQIEQAKRIMKPFVLRRLKRDVLQDLPKKTDVVVQVSLTPTQKEQYDDLVSTFQNVSKDVSNNAEKWA